MWHIDNNYHFSPFYDIRITDIVNQLSLEDIVSNALNVIIQKNIIKYNRPNFLQLLSDYKNEGNVWANYKKKFSKITLRENINKYTCDYTYQELRHTQSTFNQFRVVFLNLRD